MELNIYLGNKKKNVGRIEGGLFKKTVKKSKHLFRKTNSWGLDYNTLVNSIIPNCNTIQIYDKEEKKYYICPVTYYGEIIDGKFKKSDKVEIKQYNKQKYGVQVFLPIRYFLTEIKN